MIRVDQKYNAFWNAHSSSELFTILDFAYSTSNCLNNKTDGFHFPQWHLLQLACKGIIGLGPHSRDIVGTRQNKSQAFFSQTVGLGWPSNHISREPAHPLKPIRV